MFVIIDAMPLITACRFRFFFDYAFADDAEPVPAMF